MNRDVFWRAPSNSIRSPGTEGPGIVPVIAVPALALLRTYATLGTQRELRSLGSGGGKSQLWCHSSLQVSGPKLKVQF